MKTKWIILAILCAAGLTLFVWIVIIASARLTRTEKILANPEGWEIHTMPQEICAADQTGNDWIEYIRAPATRWGGTGEVIRVESSGRVSFGTWNWTNEPMYDRSVEIGASATDAIIGKVMTLGPENYEGYYDGLGTKTGEGLLYDATWINVLRWKHGGQSGIIKARMVDLAIIKATHDALSGAGLLSDSYPDRSW